MNTNVRMLITVIVFLSIVYTGFSVSSESSEIKVYINGKQISFDVAPQFVNEKVLVPVRATFEALNASVYWDEASQTITGVRANTTIILQINNSIAKINGDVKTLEVVPQIIAGSTFIPLRFISEALGDEVDYDSGLVTIKTNYREVISVTSTPPLTAMPLPTQMPIPVQMNNQIKVGDYVQFGKYYDEPILWKCVNKDNGVMLVSEYILCLKSFDAAESGQEAMTGGCYTEDQTRQKFGSNDWTNSNIREWLNSVEQMVNFTTQPPTKPAVWCGTNSYADEAGFLSNFSEEERNKLKSVNHNEDYYDLVYLLSESEVNSYIGNSPNVRIRQLTQKAEENKEYNQYQDQMGNFYWTRTPRPGTITSSVKGIKENGNLNAYNAHIGIGGVLPALNLQSDIYKSGKGTKDEPYIVE